MESNYRLLLYEECKVTEIEPYKIVEEKGFPAYWNNSVLKPRNFYETGLEESLEKIVMNEESELGGGMTDKVFTDKGKTLKATIKALFHQILTREKLNYVLLKQIDSDMCRAGTYLEDMRRFTARDYSRQFVDLARRRTQIEERVIGLEKEKRQEYRDCWKDLAYLTKGVLSALKDYWNARGSDTFLNSDHNDGYRGGMPQTQAYSWREGR